MKIGIVTFHFVKNYGGLLQAYALRRYLAELGHEAELIDYHPDWVENGGRFKLPFGKQAIQADMVIAYQKLTNFQQRLMGNNPLARSYADFQLNHLKIGKTRYSTLKELREHPPEYDVYVCGSDQIWNPSVQFGVDPAYFLDFGTARRISYAASFGRAEIEPRHHAEIGTLLSKFTSIGVREQSAVDLVNRLSDREATCLPDPTLLLSDYEDVLDTPLRNDDYLMSYVLRSGEGLGEIQQAIAGKRGIEIITPYNHQRRWKGIGTEVICSPGQWLGYIMDSRFVVTNSFHGTLFSVIFKKPFVFVGLGGGKAALNERSISFLERVGLSERIIFDINQQQAIRIADKEIDWAKVSALLDEWKNEARNFLQSALMSTGIPLDCS